MGVARAVPSWLLPYKRSARTILHRNEVRGADRLESDEKDVTTIHTLGGPQQMTIVSESGVMRCFWTSDRSPQIWGL
jgi:prophage antirepressor-like protein